MENTSDESRRRYCKLKLISSNKPEESGELCCKQTKVDNSSESSSESSGSSESSNSSESSSGSSESSRSSGSSESSRSSGSSSDGYFSVESDSSSESYSDPGPSKQDIINSRAAESKGAIRCTVSPCLWRFETLEDMHQHLKDDHGFNRTCGFPGCGRLCKGKYGLRRHAATHCKSESLVSKCEMCGGHLKSVLAHIGTCLQRHGVLDKVIKMVVKGDIKRDD